MNAAPVPLISLLMRRAVVVAGLVVVLGGWLCLQGLDDDVRDEVRAAGRIVELMALVAQAPGDDEARLQRLAALAAGGGLRHLAVQVRDATGRVRLEIAPPALPPALAMLTGGAGQREVTAAEWPLAGAHGEAWTMRVASSPAGEQREAAADLAGTLGLVLAVTAALLVSMRLGTAHSLAPLGRLLQAIARLGDHDPAALRALPRMPVLELEAVVGALRRMDRALSESDAQCRRLSGQLQREQEDERARIARELHDEVGQRLTAMRVIAAHHLRRQEAGSAAAAGLEALRSQCEGLQRELRTLLAGLQPFGATLDPRAPVAVERLAECLEGLASTWRSSAGLPVVLRCPRADGPAAARLPSDLALVLYRITQEALTNVARHAGASRAEVSLQFDRDPEGRPAAVRWSVQDDGVGLPAAAAALRRGNGLAGLAQRIFAAGGDLQVAPACSGIGPPGLRLSAVLPVGPC